MAGLRAGARLASLVRHPQTTVRWRLTLLYGGLFLVCGAALLAVTYTLVSHAVTGRGGLIAIGPAQATPSRGFGGPASGSLGAPAGAGVPTQLKSPKASAFVIKGKQVSVPPVVSRVLRGSAGQQAIRFVGRQQQIADLHQLEIESAIALAVMAIISALLGWVVAGRVLRPLRTITTTTQQISEASLHRRLALPGPPDELRTLADTIDGLLGRLESAFNAQRRFVANASHELRTPLTAVRALLEMVVSDPHATVETFRETCREALEESEQQEQLIDALLALAQGQRGLDRREPADLVEITEEVLRAHQADVEEAGLHIDATLEPDGQAVLSGDPRLLARLVSNLVQNAIRHNVPDGIVRIGIGTRAGWASLTIANTGPVVPADEIERLLQPFQRLTADRLGHRDGFGLGLSIVAAIAAAHHATLDVHPGEQGGLRVEVRFPIAVSHARARPPRPEPPAPVSASLA
jgi:signal transduction histidine kinase